MTDSTPTPRPRRAGRIALIAGGAAVLVAATVAITLVATRSPAPAPAGQQAETRAAGTPAATTTASIASGVAAEPTHESLVADPAALDACDMAAKTSGDKLYDPGQAKTIAQRAGQSSNAEVHRRGEALAGLADKAAAAKGRDLNANLAMGTAVQQLGTWCLQNKLAVP